MPRRRRRLRVRRACEENAGKILFLRHRDNNPCICIQNLNIDISGGAPSQQWIWIAFEDLDSQNFILYREKITAYIGKLQADVRSNIDIPEPKIIYKPPPMERAFLRQLFNCHLTEEEKKRYVVEFSNTIIGSGTCFLCLNLARKKRKCLHYECPGMCDDCYEMMEDSCPACERPQEAICPICREAKGREELCHRESSGKVADCGHAICWECLGKGYAMGKPVHECPVCRRAWTSSRVTPVPHILVD